MGLIDHPSGATDVILRLESGGGLVAYGFFATQAPTFTLYGDGSAVFRPTTDPAGTGFAPFWRAVLSAEQVDAVLRFALEEGHLATARESYSVGGVADAPTTYFTINAGGVHKVVEVYALGIEGIQPNPDSADYAAFAQLSALLGDYEQQVRLGHVVSSATYVPDQYRAILVPASGLHATAAWPWTDLTLGDFAADSFTGGLRAALSAGQAARVTQVPSGGVTGIRLASPDGSQQFTLSLRPMLPGDTVDGASTLGS